MFGLNRHLAVDVLDTSRFMTLFFINEEAKQFLPERLLVQRGNFAARCLDEIQRISEEFDLIGYYIFSQKTRVRGRDAATRMFALAMGSVRKLQQAWQRVHWLATYMIKWALIKIPF